jgi:hypothetical protein
MADRARGCSAYEGEHRDHLQALPDGRPALHACAPRHPHFGGGAQHVRRCTRAPAMTPAGVVETPCRARAGALSAKAAAISADRTGVQRLVRAAIRSAWDAAIVAQAELDSALRRKPKGDRIRCGAHCRDGHACRATPVWLRGALTVRNGRCRMHGGLSTGPRTPEGKARVSEVARRTMLRRWRARRVGAPR